MADSKDIRVIENVQYVDSPTQTQFCDIYMPKTTASEGFDGSSILIYVHGGGWIRGSKEESSKIPATKLAEKGVTVIACGYTLVDEASGKDFIVCLTDVALAVAWTRTPSCSKVLGFPPRNIFLAGHSAGGHLISMLILQSKWLEEADKKLANKNSTLDTIRGIIGMGGVYDLSSALDNNRDFESVLYPTFGKCKEKWVGYSPSTCPIGIGSKSDASSLESSNHAFYESMPWIILISSYEDEIVDDEQAEKFASRFESEEDEEGTSKAQIIRGHFGSHHEIYKMDSVHCIIAEFMKSHVTPYH